MTRRGMGTAALVVSAGILTSRLLGLLRNALLAALLGRTVQGDVYQAAFLIPDFLNYLMAGGYMSITFIPILSRHLGAGRTEDGWKAFAAVATWVGGLTSLLTILLMALSQPITQLLYPRLAPSQVAEVANLTRIVLPAQVFFVLGSLFMAVQYAHKRFALPSLAPVVYNLGIIGGGLLTAWGGEPSPAGFAWGALVGAAVGNFGLQVIGARRSGWRWTRPPRRDPAVRTYFVMALPLMIGQSIAVLDEQFVRVFGQLAPDGGIAGLAYARQLHMVPVGLIAQAAGVAAYPYLAGLAAAGRLGELVSTAARAIRHSLFAAGAAAAAMVAGATPLVRLLLQHGEFQPADTAVVAPLLAVFVISLPAWAVHQVVSRSFYARAQMWTPVTIGTGVALLAAGAAVPLYERLGLVGLAWLSSAAMTVYALILFVVWTRSGAASVRSAIAASWTRCLLSGSVAATAGRLVADRIDSTSLLDGVLGLLGAGTVAAAAYGSVALLLRSPEPKELYRRAGVSGGGRGGDV